MLTNARLPLMKGVAMIYTDIYTYRLSPSQKQPGRLHYAFSQAGSPNRFQLRISHDLAFSKQKLPKATPYQGPPITTIKGMPIINLVVAGLIKKKPLRFKRLQIPIFLPVPMSALFHLILHRGIISPNPNH